MISHQIHWDLPWIFLWFSQHFPTFAGPKAIQIFSAGLDVDGPNPEGTP